MTQQAHKKGKDFDAKPLVKILYWLTVAAGVWFAYLNIQPYAVAVKQVMLGAMPDKALVNFLTLSPSSLRCDGRFLLHREMLSNTSASKSYILSTSLNFGMPYRIC